MITLKKFPDSSRNKKNIYFSTHQFISAAICDFSDSDLALITKKSHPIRKLQDDFCYIHSTVNESKIFTTRQHKLLESSIRNNLKLFNIFYLPKLKDFQIKQMMLSEALLQKKMLGSMSYLQIVLNRHVLISYYLSYAYSRSLDYYKQYGINNA